MLPDMPIPKRHVTQETAQEVWAQILPKLVVNPSTGCMEFSGCRNVQGYGLLTVKGERYQVHRVAMQIKNGAPLGEMLACHSCDNPACGNPDHLFAGTHTDNLWDYLHKRGVPRKGENGLIRPMTEAEWAKFNTAKWFQRERKRLAYTQNEMARMLRFGRSKYIDLEMGVRKPTYVEVNGLFSVMEHLPRKNAKGELLPPRTPRPPSSKVSSPKKKTP
jgi:hypothetical protein